MQVVTTKELISDDGFRYSVNHEIKFTNLYNNKKYVAEILDITDTHIIVGDIETCEINESMESHGKYVKGKMKVKLDDISNCGYVSYW